MKKPLWLGSILVGIMLPVHFVVPMILSVQIAAVTLAIIGGAYIGFAAVDGSPRALTTELFGAGLFGTAAIIGLTIWPLAIPVGILLHAVWDCAHHNGGFGAKVPSWYIPFCVWIDLVIGVILSLIYLRSWPFA